MINDVELKRIADGLKTIGKPPSTSLADARTRAALLEDFTRLVERATSSERHELVQTLKSMLSEEEAK